MARESNKIHWSLPIYIHPMTLFRSHLSPRIHFQEADLSTYSLKRFFPLPTLANALKIHFVVWSGKPSLNPTVDFATSWRERRRRRIWYEYHMKTEESVEEENKRDEKHVKLVSSLPFDWDIFDWWVLEMVEWHEKTGCKTLACYLTGGWGSASTSISSRGKFYSFSEGNWPSLLVLPTSARWHQRKIRYWLANTYTLRETKFVQIRPNHVLNDTWVGVSISIVVTTNI